MDAKNLYHYLYSLFLFKLLQNRALTFLDFALIAVHQRKNNTFYIDALMIVREYFRSNLNENGSHRH